MSDTHYAPELETALEAVESASRLCMAVAQDRVGAGALEKADRSPVTVADFGAQALILRRLAARFERDAVLAEEDAVALREPGNAETLSLVTDYVRRQVTDASPEEVCGWIDLGKTAVTGDGSVPERFWTLDPIDGTKGFLRGEQYAIALALIVGGEVKLGVLGCPALPLENGSLGAKEPGETGILFSAVKGVGTVMGTLTGKKARAVSVSASADVREAVMVESVEAEHAGLDDHEALARQLGMARPRIRLDSQAKYAIVARGEAEIYLRLPNRKRPDYRAKIWDHAAGKILVEEAGGRVTDVAGKPLDFGHGEKLLENSGMVVTNGAVHEALLEAIRKMG